MCSLSRTVTVINIGQVKVYISLVCVGVSWSVNARLSLFAVQ